MLSVDGLLCPSYYALGVGTIYNRYIFQFMSHSNFIGNWSLHKWSHLGLGCFISLDIQLLPEKEAILY